MKFLVAPFLLAAVSVGNLDNVGIANAAPATSRTPAGRRAARITNNNLFNYYPRRAPAAPTNEGVAAAANEGAAAAAADPANQGGGGVNQVQVVNGLTGSCVAVSTSIDTFYGDGGESPALVSTSHDNLTTISLFDQGEQAVLLPTSHVDDSFRGEHGGGFAALDDDSSLRHGGGGRLAALVATTVVCSLLFKLLSFVIGIAAGLPLFVTRWLEHQSSNFVRESYNPNSKCNHYGFVSRMTRGGCKLRNECLGRRRGKHKHNHSGQKYMSGGCRKVKKGNRDRPHHTNHSEKKKKRRDRSKKKVCSLLFLSRCSCRHAKSNCLSISLHNLVYNSSYTSISILETKGS